MIYQDLRIPTRDLEFNEYQLNLRNYLNLESPPGPEVNYIRLGVLPGEMEAIMAFGAQWDLVFAPSQENNTRTPVLVEEKDTIKKEFIAYIRPILGRIDKSPNITIPDRGALHLPVRDTNPTPRGRITEAPYIKLISLKDGLVKVRVRMNRDASRASMNPLADAVEMRYKIGGGPPRDVEDCPHSNMSKKSIFFFEAGHDKSTQRLWCYFRWVNLSNPANSGPFGLPQQLVIQ